MNYQQLLSRTENKILVIGDIMLDVYQYGKCSRISPEAPVPVIDFSKEDKMLGGAGNVLRNLVSFGAKCEIISVVGEDLSGALVSEQLDELQIESKLLIVDRSRKTTEKCRIVCSGQQLIRVDKEDRHPLDIQIENDIIDYVRNNINDYKVIVFSDYSKGVLTEKICLEIINIAKTNNILTLVDPKGSNFKKYKNIDLIKPNLKEAEILIGKKINSRDEIMSACEELKEFLECKQVVITLSEDGIALLDVEFEIVPTVSCPVFDVSGAGDTVLASIAFCLLHNFSLLDSSKFANTAASIVIQKFGAQTTTVKEVINEINKIKVLSEK
jgi:D-beta-D-heptose 7-phosphate kinase/D-beta-D-heptose 1-phosphate adenosyltransferase